MNDHNLKHTRALEDYITFFEKLSRRSIPLLEKIVAPDVYFKDPFNEVYTVEGLQNIFAHMFETLDMPKFQILDYAFTNTPDTALIHWRFKYSMKGNKHAFEGTSLVTFDNKGLVKSHIDYWDSAEHVYERVPVLGGLIRFVKAKLAA